MCSLGGLRLNIMSYRKNRNLAARGSCLNSELILSGVISVYNTAAFEDPVKQLARSVFEVLVHQYMSILRDKKFFGNLMNLCVSTTS